MCCYSLSFIFACCVMISFYIFVFINFCSYAFYFFFVFFFFFIYAFFFFFFFFQAEDGIRDHCVTGVQTCALPIFPNRRDTGAACQKPSSMWPESREGFFVPGCSSSWPMGRLQAALGISLPPREEIGRASCRERV